MDFAAGIVRRYLHTGDDLKQISSGLLSFSNPSQGIVIGNGHCTQTGLPCKRDNLRRRKVAIAGNGVDMQIGPPEMIQLGQPAAESGERRAFGHC